VAEKPDKQGASHDMAIVVSLQLAKPLAIYSKNIEHVLLISAWLI
jgi:hypothetical protein